MRRFLPGVVKCGLKAVGSRVIDWLQEWTKPDNHGLVGGAVADTTRSKSELMLENALLRQQLIVVSRQVVQLMRRMARENPLWGAERIRGEMLKQHIGVAKSSIQKYTQDIQRVGPSGQTWGSFLCNHASEIWACDFLQTYDALFRSIFVFVIIELESRRVVHVNVTRHPTDAWVAQQLREATPFGEGPCFLIRDNDKKYGEQFQHVVDGVDIDLLKTPVEAPHANAFCERFLGSLRRECLDYMLILSERHLRRIVSEYVTYFNQARPHQGINQHIPCAPHLPDHPEGEIVGVPVLGGLHHDYRRKAA